MEILEAFDLTGSFRAAGELAGCSHHTVAEWVARRDQGLLPGPLEVVERGEIDKLWKMLFYLESGVAS